MVKTLLSQTGVVFIVRSMFEQSIVSSHINHSFVYRMLRSVGLAGLIILLSLLLGILGYHWIEGLSWVDAYLESAMIAAGMGSTVTLKSTAGKFFAGTYALYCGFALIVAIGVVLAPIVQHVLHRFHLDVDKRK